MYCSRITFGVQSADTLGGSWGVTNTQVAVLFMRIWGYVLQIRAYGARRMNRSRDIWIGNMSPLYVPILLDQLQWFLVQ